VNSALQLSAILERQREAFLRDGPPSLARRRADLAKLKQAVKDPRITLPTQSPQISGAVPGMRACSPKCSSCAPRSAMRRGICRAG